jgi:hypothetical protein
MYMFRAYQSPCSGTHCGLQCAQIPNFASRNQSGQRYDFKDSQNGRNGPSGTSPRKKGDLPAALAIPDNASALALLSRNDLRFKIAASFNERLGNPYFLTLSSVTSTTSLLRIGSEN